MRIIITNKSLYKIVKLLIFFCLIIIAYFVGVNNSFGLNNVQKQKAYRSNESFSPYLDLDESLDNNLDLDLE
jgi:hypothetical protein